MAALSGAVPSVTAFFWTPARQHSIVNHRIELVRNPLLRLRTVHDAERRPLPVELDERLRRPLVHL
jgi:hypothetical protein